MVPGVNQDLNSKERYSRTHTVYDKVSSDSNFPVLISAAPGATSDLRLTLGAQGADASGLIAGIRQYNTLNLHNSRMCCTGNWVRSFASENGGGYRFSGTTQQNIPIDTFKTLSWFPNNEPEINDFDDYDPTLLRFTCNPQDIETADCEIKNIVENSAEETKFLEWFGKFELLGIPQVLIEANRQPIQSNDIIRPIGDSTLDSSEDSQSDISSDRKPLPNTIKDNNVDGDIDAIYDGKEYYSAASYDNFEIGSGQLKKVFSESEFNCCIPTGIQVAGDTPNTACCTGQKAANTPFSEEPVCCLNDFADVSVYTNRYVSSEGAFLNGQKISDSDIDETTGYIRKEVVLQMASTMCCSGRAVFGNVISNLPIPVNFDEAIANANTRRWLYNEVLDDSSEAGSAVSKYNLGLKWNDHVYCVPAGLSNGSGGSSGGGSTQD